MKIIFVDTNVLVDLIAGRKPFSKYAVELFSKAELKKVKLYTSSHSFAVTHYLLKKYIDEKKLREIMFSLLDYIALVPIDTEIIKKGLLLSTKIFKMRYR
ncbi:MAG TPA: PIN domain-containing protein [Cytophagaceae bacterium]|jgi:predicted nucleic acid-binding protein|nr:PIN domain-containing protein [Cytophagaceae bacterium]